MCEKSTIDDTHSLSCFNFTQVSWQGYWPCHSQCHDKFPLKA